MRSLAVAVVLASLALVAPAAGEDQGPLAARDELVAGRSLTQWDVAWNRWVFAHRSAPKSEACYPDGDHDPVWFLVGGGSGDGHVITIKCNIPANRWLLFALPQVICTDVFPGEARTKVRDLSRCTVNFWRSYGDAHPRLVIDGQAAVPGHLVRTPAFAFTMPERGNIFGVRGRRRGHAAAKGFSMMIRPPPAGEHKIVVGMHPGLWHNQVLIFRLTVG